MKTRTGFVSNSSTTSFVVLTTQQNHDAAVKKVIEQNEQGYFEDPTDVGPLKKLKPLTKVRLLGNNFVEIYGAIGNSDWISSGKYVECSWEVIDAYQKALGDGEDVFMKKIES